MKTLFTLFALLITLVSFSQTDFALRINHKLGTEPFALDATGTNNLGHDFKTTRLEYYLSQITLIHDGGEETAIDLDVIALVNAGDEVSTTIPLGEHDITTVDAVKFYIGVYEPINNADPSLQPDDHPLAPQSPSMHWGWASGYRFLAYEGNSGSGFAQIFQLHGLGNENYFETESFVLTTTEGDLTVLNVDANYEEGLRDIDLSGGVISHGTTDEAKLALENWRDHVFGIFVSSIDEENAIEWSVFPNPSMDNTITINIADNSNNLSFQLTNTAGQIIEAGAIINGSIKMNINDAGVYMVSILKDNTLVSTKQVVIR